MTMIEKYYTAEQLRQPKTAGRERRAGAAAPQMWADLHADMKDAMDAGMDPTDPKAQNWRSGGWH